MDDYRKKAFDFAADATKQVLTLSTGILALTITFTKDILGGSHGFSPLLGWAWACYLVSIFFGIWALLAITGELEPNPDARRPAATAPTIRGSNVRIPSVIQLFTFLIATGLIVWFAITAPRSA